MVSLPPPPRSRNTVLTEDASSAGTNQRVPGRQTSCTARICVPCVISKAIQSRLTCKIQLPACWDSSSNTAITIQAQNFKYAKGHKSLCFRASKLTWKKTSNRKLYTRLFFSLYHEQKTPPKLSTKCISRVPRHWDATWNTTKLGSFIYPSTLHFNQ